MLVILHIRRCGGVSALFLCPSYDFYNLSFVNKDYFIYKRCFFHSINFFDLFINDRLFKIRLRYINNKIFCLPPCLFYPVINSIFSSFRPKRF